MKQLIAAALLLTLLVSCKNTEGSTKRIAANEMRNKYSNLYGIWSGDMEPVYREHDTVSVQVKKVTIKINKIIGDNVYGQSLIAGVQRPLVGKISEKGSNGVVLTLDEPGTNPYDGRFELEMQDGEFFEGTHIAFQESPDTTPIKKLKISHKKFIYNPKFMLDQDIDLVDWESAKQQEVEYEEEFYDGEEGDTIEIAESENDTLDGEAIVHTEEVYRMASEEVFRINASVQRLTEEELKNLRKLDLEIIRNTIFARHGYSFKKDSVRHFFEVNSWYVPVSENVDNELTTLEKENIALLTRFEKYAEDHYDSFGR